MSASVWAIFRNKVTSYLSFVCCTFVAHSLDFLISWLEFCSKTYLCCYFPFDLHISTVSGLTGLVNSFICFLISILSRGSAQQRILKEVWCWGAPTFCISLGWEGLAQEQIFWIILVPASSCSATNRKSEKAISNAPANTTAEKDSCPLDLLFWLLSFLWFIWHTPLPEPFLGTTPATLPSSTSCFVLWELAVRVRWGLGWAARGGFRCTGTSPAQKCFRVAYMQHHLELSDIWCCHFGLLLISL